MSELPTPYDFDTALGESFYYRGIAKDEAATHQRYNHIREFMSHFSPSQVIALIKNFGSMTGDTNLSTRHYLQAASEIYEDKRVLKKILADPMHPRLLDIYSDDANSVAKLNPGGYRLMLEHLVLIEQIIVWVQNRPQLDRKIAMQLLHTLYPLNQDQMAQVKKLDDPNAEFPIDKVLTRSYELVIERAKPENQAPTIKKNRK